MPVGGIWADDFDRKMADVFLVQDEIVGQIVGKIAAGYGVIENTEAKSATRKSPEQVQAYDLVLRARETMQWDWTSDNFRAAREALNRARLEKATGAAPGRVRQDLRGLVALVEHARGRHRQTDGRCPQIRRSRRGGVGPP